MQQGRVKCPSVARKGKFLTNVDSKCLSMSPHLVVCRVTTLTTCLPVFHYLRILMTSDSCFLLHHYFVEGALLITYSIFLTASFIFSFSFRYFLIRFLYVTFNSVFLMLFLIFSYSLQQHFIFLIFYLFYVSSLYFVLFLISCYKNLFHSFQLVPVIPWY